MFQFGVGKSVAGDWEVCWVIQGIFIHLVNLKRSSLTASKWASPYAWASINSTHIPILCPSQGARDFSFIIFQGVITHHCCFIHLFTSRAGSALDAKVFHNPPLVVENGYYTLMTPRSKVDKVIIPPQITGDLAYSFLPWKE